LFTDTKLVVIIITTTVALGFFETINNHASDGGNDTGDNVDDNNLYPHNIRLPKRPAQL